MLMSQYGILESRSFLNRSNKLRFGRETPFGGGIVLYFKPFEVINTFPGGIIFLSSEHWNLKVIANKRSIDKDFVETTEVSRL